MGRDINPVDNVMAILARKELIYLLGEDPGGLIAKRFPAHPDHAFVVEWLVSDEYRVLSLWLTDTGQVHKGNCMMEQTALFDTYEEAKAAAEEFDCRAGAGTTIPVKYEVGTLPPPKGGSRSWRAK